MDASIILNGRITPVHSPLLNYEEIVRMVYPNVSEEIAQYCTVMFSKGHLPKPEGCLCRGEKLDIKAGMIICAMFTGDA